VSVGVYIAASELEGAARQRERARRSGVIAFVTKSHIERGSFRVVNSIVASHRE